MGLQEMKVAICISGHLRTYKKNIDLFNQRILSPINSIADQVDIFIHTWDKIDTVDSWTYKTRGIFNKSEQEPDIEFLKQNLNYKKLVIEIQRDKFEELNISNILGVDVKEYNSIYNGAESYTNITDGNGLFFQIPMVYKWWACNELKKEYEQEKNFNYDYVVRHRMDALPDKPIIPDFFTGKTLLLNFKNHLGIGDLIWISDNDTMNIMCDFYLHLDKYFQPRGTEMNLLPYALDNNINFRWEHHEFGVTLIKE